MIAQFVLQDEAIYICCQLCRESRIFTDDIQEKDSSPMMDCDSEEADMFGNKKKRKTYISELRGATHQLPIQTLSHVCLAMRGIFDFSPGMSCFIIGTRTLYYAMVGVLHTKQRTNDGHT